MKINFDKLQGSEKLISLVENKFTEDMKIEEIPSLLYLSRNGKKAHLGGRGEVTIFFGPPKSGKSIVLEMITGVLLREDGEMGPLKKCETAKNILYIDMEQSILEWSVAMNRVMKYSNISSIPSNFLSMNFTSEFPTDRSFYLKELLNAIEEVDVVILDGVADLVDSDSNPDIAKVSSEELKSLAVSKDCLIIGVLHTDAKGTRPRDHIGTKYQKIASSLIRVEKSEHSNMFSLKSYMNRNSGDWESVNFYVNTDNKMVDFRSLEKSKDFKGANFVNTKKDTTFTPEEDGWDILTGNNKIKNLKNLKDGI